LTDLVQLAGQRWDAIVVGTGMGGATVGYALARAGWRVLFCEKGRSTLDGTNALRGDYAESHFTGNPGSAADSIGTLARAGRQAEAICDLSGARPRRFVPFVGSGTGGSSALYGMALERFFPADFTPRTHHAEAAESTLPDQWPISYAELAPFYEMAERLYRVRGSPDPLKDNESASAMDAAPEFSRATRAFADCLERRGLHPYHLPMACAYVPNCQGCQGYLCALSCKRDSATVCLAPALEEHGATLVDECEVLRLESDGHAVTGVVCRRRGAEARLEARTIILAAGALATPGLLLRSRSQDFPRGLANTSGMVGKNLMRHFVDLYAIFQKGHHAADGNVKELGCNDFYVTPEGKYGSLQSFGRLPPARTLVESMASDLHHDVGRWAAFGVRIARPVIEPLVARVFSRQLMLASILEDLPYAHNEVTTSDGSDETGVCIRYRIDAPAAKRIVDFRRMISRALKPHRFLLIKQAQSNERLAHVCGTCRFGLDPRTSVLNSNNQTHDLANLYVVDASFFPSSGGTNPALTIGANALRVAEHVIRLHQAKEPG